LDVHTRIIAAPILIVNRRIDINIDENIRMTIGTRVRAARKKRGMTQKQLADKSGISQSTLSALETGDSSGSYNLVAIASALGEDPVYLETGRTDAAEGAQLAQRIAQLTSAQRQAVKAVIDSYAGLRPAATTDEQKGGDGAHPDEYKRRILALIDRMDDRAKSDAEEQLAEIVREYEDHSSGNGTSSDAPGRTRGSVEQIPLRRRK
jgi:transcriptional regulator with XRE-family HTH domain